MRQSIRGYTDAVIEEISGGEQLSEAASQLAAVRQVVDRSDDLRLVLGDPAQPVATRRGVVDDLLRDRIGSAALRLIDYIVVADRPADFHDDLIWLASRVDAAAREMTPIGEPVLGRSAATERLDGYADGVLELVQRDRLGGIEDELFRFLRIAQANGQLRTALTSRDLAAGARRDIVVDLLRDRASDAAARLAGYATQVGRSRDYLDLLSHLVDRVAAESDRRLAEVRAPVDLDDAQRQELAQALSRVAGRSVEVRVTVDPSVLGGFLATVGDTVVDGSARHRLELLKERLVMPEADITIGERS